MLEDVREFAEELQQRFHGEYWQVRRSLENLCRPNTTTPPHWHPVVFAYTIEVHKLVACCDGELRSVFSCSHAYSTAPGKATRARRGAASHPPLSECLYCYRTKGEAVRAPFPEGSTSKAGPFAMLRLKGRGGGFVSESSGKIALGWVQPVEVVDHGSRHELLRRH